MTITFKMHEIAHVTNRINQGSGIPKRMEREIGTYHETICMCKKTERNCTQLIFLAI